MDSGKRTFHKAQKGVTRLLVISDKDRMSHSARQEKLKRDPSVFVFAGIVGPANDGAVE